MLTPTCTRNIIGPTTSKTIPSSIGGVRMMLPQRMREQAAQFTRGTRIRSAVLTDAQITLNSAGIDQKTSASGPCEATGCADRHVVGRKDNVVIVDFRTPDSPPPYFPGGGALRIAVVADDETPGSAYQHHDVQQRR
jgi:hypothetical protein